MSLIERFQILSDAYCEATGVTREQASYRIFADQRRLASVFAGQASLRVASLERAVAWFSEQWPADLAWPEGFDRPEPRVSEAAE